MTTLTKFILTNELACRFFIKCSTWNNCHVNLFGQVLKSTWAVLFSHSVLGWFRRECSTWNNFHMNLFSQVLQSTWEVHFSHSVLGWFRRECSTWNIFIYLWKLGASTWHKQPTFPSVLWNAFGVSVPRGTIVIWTYSAKYLNRRERLSFPTVLWNDSVLVFHVEQLSWEPTQPST